MTTLILVQNVHSQKPTGIPDSKTLRHILNPAVVLLLRMASNTQPRERKLFDCGIKVACFEKSAVQKFANVSLADILAVFPDL